MEDFPTIVRALEHRITTPAPIVLLDVVQENIQRMQRFADEHGKALRPHVKTHKSIEIARLQLLAGACGLTAGTLGEAQVFADAGFDDIFLAYPVWPTPSRGERLRRLARQVQLRLGVENREVLEPLAAALGDDRDRLGLVIEIDCGARRSGVAPADAGGLAAEALRLGLRVDGVFTYPGHGGKLGAREGAAQDQAESLRTAVRELENVGVDVRVVSAGSTPTAGFSTDEIITEIRPGEYAFNDCDNLRLGNCTPEQIGIMMATTVVSDQGHDHVIVDSGTKALSRDGDAERGWGDVPEVNGTITLLNEYHGFLRLPDGGPRPPVGTVLPIVPRHVCAVINNFPEVVLADREGRYLGTWRVEAQGQLN